MLWVVCSILLIITYFMMLFLQGWKGKVLFGYVAFYLIDHFKTWNFFILSLFSIIWRTFFTLRFYCVIQTNLIEDLWFRICMKFTYLELFFKIFSLSYSYVVIRKVENLTNSSSSELLACRWVLIIDLDLRCW